MACFLLILSVMTQVNNNTSYPNIHQIDGTSPEYELMSTETIGGVKIFFYKDPTLSQDKIDQTNRKMKSFFEEAVSYFKEANLKLPSVIGVVLEYFPGKKERSHAHTNFSFICLDIEKVLEKGTVIHELAHLATSNLCSLEGDYNYLVEGFASWFEGVSMNVKSTHLQERIVSFNEEESCSTDPVIIGTQPSCYDDGVNIWRRVEKECGRDKVLQIIRSIEGVENITPEKVDEIFIKETNLTPKQWIDKQIKGSADNYSFASSAENAMYFGRNYYQMQPGISLNRFGSIGRALVAPGVGYNSGALSVSLGYKVYFPYLYPFGWNDDKKGFKFGKPGVESGFKSHLIKKSDGDVKIGLEPYARFSLGFGYHFGRTSIVGHQLNFGAATMVGDQSPEIMGYFSYTILD